MEPDTRYTLIGIAVLALTALAVAAYLWLSSGGRGSDFRFYTVYFVHQSLDGLQVGAAVNMRGIPVGRVDSVAFEPDEINRVRVVVRVARDAPVRDNTQATILSNVGGVCYWEGRWEDAMSYYEAAATNRSRSATSSTRRWRT